MQNINSNKFPIEVGLIHFIGIGGIGMSGIAEILYNLGYEVQGSDTNVNPNVIRLQNLGIKVYTPQKEENILQADIIVKSSAIKDDNAEIIAAKKNNIPIILRAEMLAELMRLKFSVAIAGTHGKTTTTTMMTHLFEAQNLSPTVVNGGIINAYGTNAKLGEGKWLVAEADESDGSFLKLPATIGVITNIDPEHMEHYGSFENLKNSFKNFVSNLPFFGFCVICKDHDVTDDLFMGFSDRKIITYGIDKKSDVNAINIVTQNGISNFDVVLSSHVKNGNKIIKNVILPMPGKHNILNALASIAVAVELGFGEENIRQGFMSFKGVKRRFTEVGQANGITIIDDYGHHPNEIAVTLKTAKEVLQGKNGSVIAVAQPHRYSRVKDLFTEFCNCFFDADKVLIADIYEAGESPLVGINKESLVEGIKKAGHKDVATLSGEDQLPIAIKQIANQGDIVVCLGAGSITNWANNLALKILDQ